MSAFIWYISNMAYLSRMKSYAFCGLLAIMLSLSCAAQKDSAGTGSVFDRITKEVTAYMVDTTAVPEDKITQTIRELRSLRGGFNIQEAIAFKLDEEAHKGEMPRERIDFLREAFRTGKGREWLDNAVIRIYREHFSYKELRQLVRFYRTPAGQKLATDFPSIMLMTLKAGEFIQSSLMKQMESR